MMINPCSKIFLFTKFHLIKAKLVLERALNGLCSDTISFHSIFQPLQFSVQVANFQASAKYYRYLPTYHHSPSRSKLYSFASPVISRVFSSLFVFVAIEDSKQVLSDLQGLLFCIAVQKQPRNLFSQHYFVKGWAKLSCFAVQISSLI